jgi:hypothetical protein
VSTGFALNFFVGVFVTCTPVPIPTVLLTGVELAYPLLAVCVCAFEVSALVLPPPPQAATANELNATGRIPYVTLDLIRDICCSCHWGVVTGRTHLR